MYVLAFVKITDHGFAKTSSKRKKKSSGKYPLAIKSSKLLEQCGVRTINILVNYSNGQAVTIAWNYIISLHIANIEKIFGFFWKNRERVKTKLRYEFRHSSTAAKEKDRSIGVLNVRHWTFLRQKLDKALKKKVHFLKRNCTRPKENEMTFFTKQKNRTKIFENCKYLNSKKIYGKYN